MTKRISFQETDASSIYELAVEHFQPECFHCADLKKRLEKFLGLKEVNRIKRLIRKNGYCNKLAK